jgi:sulfur relay protein TusB/DsrH
MALHIIKTGQAEAVNQVERIFQDGDQVLLLEDGCYLYTLASQRLINVAALADHVKVRGLTAKAGVLGIELISIKQWALLSRNHQQSTSW